MAFNSVALVIAVHVSSKSAALMFKTIAERIIATERTIERTFFDVFIIICLLILFWTFRKRLFAAVLVSTAKPALADARNFVYVIALCSLFVNIFELIIRDYV